MGSELRVRLGTDETRFHHGPVRIGSGRHDDIRVTDARVQPGHVVLRQDGDAWTADRTGPARTMYVGGQSRKSFTFSVPEVVRLGGKDGPELVLQPIPEDEPDLALHYIAELQKEQLKTARWLKALSITLAVALVGLLFVAGVWGRFDDLRRGLELRDAEAATVLLVARDGDGNEIASGSGTLIESSGLILTNAHVAALDAPGLNLRYGAEYPGPRAASIDVRMVPEGDDFAEHQFTASPVVADGWLDLALVQIHSDAEGQPVTEDLDLPSVELGDRRMDRGDTVHVLGFPALAGANAQRITTGQVASWQDEARVHGDGRDVIDTTAAISGGNSGGAMVDERGELIAVPMAVRSDIQHPLTAGLARPVGFADGLLAVAGQDSGGYVSPYVVPPTGEEEAELVGWSQWQDGACGVPDPQGPPSGATFLCATFTVENMETGLDIFFGLEVPDGRFHSVQYDGQDRVQFVVELDDPLYTPIEWRLDVGGGARTLADGTVGSL